MSVPLWSSAQSPARGFSSVQFSRSIMSGCLRPRGLQHARLPCPSPTPRAYSNSCPLSLWCHSNISSSVVLFFSRLQSFPASGSFPMSQFLTSGGQSIGEKPCITGKDPVIYSFKIHSFIKQLWSPTRATFAYTSISFCDMCLKKFQSSIWPSLTYK